jgi:hypothetical protein
VELSEANLVFTSHPNIAAARKAGSMSGQKIEKAEWQDFFCSLSRCVNGMLAELVFDPTDPGAYLKSCPLPLVGVIYNPTVDVLKITLEGLDQTITSLREVSVVSEAGELLCFEVIDSQGGRQIVHLMRPLKRAGYETAWLQSPDRSTDWLSARLSGERIAEDSQ